jgi:mycothiol synthase
METHIMEKLVIQSNQIILPDAPPISGLTFRGFQGESDYPSMAEIIDRCKKADHIERVETAEDVARNYRHLVNSDPYRDMLFAEVNDDVIAYQRVYWRTELDGTRIYALFGFLVPEWRHRGIGRAMFHHAERRLIEIAKDHPNNVSRFFEAECADTETMREKMVIQEGYKPVRHFFNMVRPDLENIPEITLADGVEIRPVLPEHYQKIRNASMEAFEDEWGFSPEEEPTVEQWLEDPIFDPTLWRVAWEGDQVVGMVLSFINKSENQEYNRLRGWTENICVRRPWRKRGIAKALIAASLHAIQERGMKEAALGVDTENLSGALRLYESMGYQVIKRFTLYRKPLEL